MIELRRRRRGCCRVDNLDVPINSGHSTLGTTPAPGNQTRFARAAQGLVAVQPRSSAVCADSPCLRSWVNDFPGLLVLVDR